MNKFISAICYILIAPLYFLVYCAAYLCMKFEKKYDKNGWVIKSYDR